MASKNTEMQAIFNELSEKNKDIVTLIARSMKVAQEAAEEPCGPPAQETEHCPVPRNMVRYRCSEYKEESL